MYDALVETREVQGILADIYTASYYMEKIDDPRLVISTILSSQRSIGFVIAHNENKEYINKKGECLRKLFKYRQRDIKKIIFKYTRAFHVSWEIYTITLWFKQLDPSGLYWDIQQTKRLSLLLPHSTISTLRKVQSLLCHDRGINKNLSHRCDSNPWPPRSSFNSCISRHPLLFRSHYPKWY